MENWGTHYKCILNLTSSGGDILDPLLSLLKMCTFTKTTNKMKNSVNYKEFSIYSCIASWAFWLTWKFSCVNTKVLCPQYFVVSKFPHINFTQAFNWLNDRFVSHRARDLEWRIGCSMQWMHGHICSAFTLWKMHYAFMPPLQMAGNGASDLSGFRAMFFSCTYVKPLWILVEQEAQLSLSDRAMRRVSWNVANYHATVQKLLVRQVLNKSKLWSWSVTVS